MSHIPKVMNAFARILSYPDQHTAQAAELLFIVLQGEIEDAASEMSHFGAFLEQHEAWQIEEAFTGTFDVNPSCALEVGWHLFGEEYARGMFLVRMREELRKYNLAESSELPDHISHVLSIVAAMPEDEAEKFVRACVQPAIEKMDDALADKDTPYQHVFSSLRSVVAKKWGASPSNHQQEVLKSQSSALDPLHAFPVAEIGCGDSCSGSCGEPDLVTLENNFPSADRPRSTAISEDRS